jgi:hypothetical protein
MFKEKEELEELAIPVMLEVEIQVMPELALAVVVEV